MYLTAYIGLGSNLQHPLVQVKTAINEIDEFPGTKVTAVSKLYSSEPINAEGTQNFVNAVVEVATNLTPQKLLQQMLTLELKHGRKRHQAVKNAMRTLDLDLLLFGDCQITTDFLQVPHPRLANRKFVLQPLIDVAPNLILPTGEAVNELLRKCNSQKVEQITEQMEEA